MGNLHRPARRGSRHLLQLVREQQHSGALTITFSVTRRCPLSCDHCSVEAGPKVRSPILGEEFAEVVVAQLPELAANDLKFVGFTGGEPTLAASFVRRVSDACLGLGIKTGITSAAHWASNEARALRMLDRLPNVTRWDLSTDRYHVKEVPIERLERAFRLLTARGRAPLVRFAYLPVTSSDTTPALDAVDTELVRQVHSFAGDQISFQPIDGRGRGRGLAQLRKSCSNGSSLLCFSEGLYIDEHGRISPCGSLLAAEAGSHPLSMGNAFHEPLVAVLQRWRTHPLLQLLRLGSLPQLLVGSAPDEKPSARLRGSSDCERCVNLQRDVTLTSWLEGALRSEQMQHAIADSVRAELGEGWMAEALASAPGQPAPQLRPV